MGCPGQVSCHQGLALIFKHVVRGEAAGQTHVQWSHERPSAGWPHCPSVSPCPMLSPSAPHCATLSLDVPCCPRASLAVPTLSVNGPLSPCCSPAAPPTPLPAGLPVRAGLLPAEAPLALHRESSATPAAAAARGPGNTRETPLGPGNDGKPRSTLGAPFGLGGTRAEAEPRAH